MDDGHRQPEDGAPSSAGGRRGQGRRGWLLRAVASAGLAAGASVGGLVAVGGPAAATAAVRAEAPARVTKKHVHDVGSFFFSGPLSGRLLVTATTCGASRTTPSLELLWSGTITTLKGLPAKPTVAFEIDLAGSRYGRSGRFGHVAGKPPMFIVSEEGARSPELSWHSVSGTFHTAARGTSGSVRAVLAPTAPTKGAELSVHGSWTSCE